MGGGLMQLVAYGAQDIYLTGNPQITFFKVVYRRHTNFSMETIQQTINGTPSKGGSSTVTVSRNGDLVYKVYVCSADGGSAAGAIENGSGLVNEVELEIGGQRIDRQTSEWMQMWYELTTPASKAVAFKSMVGDIGYSGGDFSDVPKHDVNVGKIQIPLQFWFCRNPGLALPLIALQYHEVKLKFTWGSGSAGEGAEEAEVWADYIYLDTDERRRFAQVSHEYLIEQIQYQSASGNSSNKLNFNHPVKELLWTSQQSADYATAKLILNGHDRFAEQTCEYFQLRQPYDYHTSVPLQNIPLREGVGESSARVSPPTAQVAGSAPTAANPISVNTAAHATHQHISYFRASATPPKKVPVGSVIKVVNITQGTEEIGHVKTSGMNSDRTIVRLTLNSDLTTASVLNDDIDLIVLSSSVQGSTEAATTLLTKKINVYSFALKPEEHQPSGTCNFSRIDSAKLDFTTSIQGIPDLEVPNSSQNIYAVNYNVLRIMSGMGGLAYSN